MTWRALAGAMVTQEAHRVPLSAGTGAVAVCAARRQGPYLGSGCRHRHWGRGAGAGARGLSCSLTVERKAREGGAGGWPHPACPPDLACSEGGHLEQRTPLAKLLGPACQPGPLWGSMLPQASKGPWPGRAPSDPASGPHPPTHIPGAWTPAVGALHRLTSLSHYPLPCL